MPKPGVALPSLQELQAAGTRAGLSKFKLPVRLWIWPEPSLPRGATGKTLKREVRKWAVDSLTAQPASKL